MFLQHIIKHIVFTITFCTGISANSQPFQTEKYSKEYNPYFKFSKFERGVSSALLSKKLDVLEGKNKENWTVKDSIEFAEISLLTSNIKLSKYYLESIEGNKHYSKYAMQLLLLDCYLENDFETGDHILSEYFSSKDLTSNYFGAIYKAHRKFVDNGELDTSIFDLNHLINKKIVKGSEEHRKMILEPLEAANATLKFYVKFIHEDDPVIAKAFNEMGQVLEYHVSLNQAYIAYSIARIYNSKDKTILNNVKQIKAKHVLKNYNTPKFRTYFPRIEYWRFDYEILKEKIILEKQDTIPKIVPALSVPPKKPPFNFPVDMLIPIGIGVILVLFAIFTRSKRK